MIFSHLCAHKMVHCVCHSSVTGNHLTHVKHLFLMTSQVLCQVTKSFASVGCVQVEIQINSSVSLSHLYCWRHCACVMEHVFKANKMNFDWMKTTMATTFRLRMKMATKWIMRNDENENEIWLWRLTIIKCKCKMKYFRWSLRWAQRWWRKMNEFFALMKWQIIPLSSISCRWQLFICHLSHFHNLFFEVVEMLKQPRWMLILIWLYFVGRRFWPKNFVLLEALDSAIKTKWFFVWFEINSRFISLFPFDGNHSKFISFYFIICRRFFRFHFIWHH